MVLLIMVENKSRKYLSKLSVPERTVLARHLGVTAKYLYHIATSRRNPSREMTIRLELITEKKVKAYDFDREERERQRSI